MKEVAAAVIESNGYFAILKRKAGPWTFPSGQVEPGETEEETCVREAKEETGMTVVARSFLGERTVADTDIHISYFACDTVEGSLQIAEPDKFERAEWKTADEIIALFGDRLAPTVRHHLVSHSERTLEKPGP